MFPKPKFSIQKQQGSMLIIAMFVLFVLMFLAASMTNILSGSGKTVVHEVYGLRAQQAAHAGIQSLLAATFPVGSSTTDCTGSVNSDPSFSNIEGFRNCSYVAFCLTEPTSFNSVDYVHFNYASVGTCDTGDGIVSRTLYVNAMEEDSP